MNIKPGKLTLITGPMFAGKTSRLIRAALDVPPPFRRVYKPSLDTRYAADELVAHRGKHGERRIPAIPLESIDEIPLHQFPNLAGAMDVHAVFVDEVQFFPELCVMFVVRSMLDDGVNVTVAGLHRDIWGEVFPTVYMLSRMAKRHFRLYADVPCSTCGYDAKPLPCTQRITPLRSTNPEDLVGGAEDYAPVCESCWRPPTVIESHTREGIE